MIYTMSATKGKQVKLPVRMDAETTGLTLSDFTLVCTAGSGHVSDPATTLSLSLSEVDSANAPGLYVVTLTPHQTGLITLVFKYGGEVQGVYLQVGLADPSITQIGADGTYTYTIEDSGSNPIEGVVVRVFSSAGGGLISKGVTNASGQISFDLPAGNYQARFYKSGWSFTNPQSFTVDEGEDESPYAEYLLPTTASVGDNVAVVGLFFTGDNVRVLVGDTVVVPDVSANGRVLVFAVPTTTSPATIRVRKDDPENPGQYLLSDPLTLTVS